MKTIKENGINEMQIKNSRFITILIKITNDCSILKEIEKYKKLYPKATHYCYAYRTENIQKAEDDGEPSGTAGTPMLEVLKKENIVQVLAITIRYFGGIKLGAGGLIRAYSKSVREALRKTSLQELEVGIKLCLTINYNMQKKVDHLLKGYPIIEKKYQEQITYTVLVPEDHIKQLEPYSYQILGKEYIEKIR